MAAKQLSAPYHFMAGMALRHQQWRCATKTKKSRTHLPHKECSEHCFDCHAKPCCARPTRPLLDSRRAKIPARWGCDPRVEVTERNSPKATTVLIRTIAKHVSSWLESDSGAQQDHWRSDHQSWSHCPHVLEGCFTASAQGEVPTSTQVHDNSKCKTKTLYIPRMFLMGWTTRIHPAERDGVCVTLYACKSSMINTIMVAVTSDTILII